MIFHAMNPYHMQAIMAAYSVIIMLILIKFYNPYEGMCTGWRPDGQTKQSFADWGPGRWSFILKYFPRLFLNENKHRGKASRSFKFY